METPAKSNGSPVEAPLPRRMLGRTGHEATLFSLGGEGILRTHGRMAEAIQVIHRALDQGVNYCDTAPAYDESLDYYGAALGERRREIFLASKTHERTRDSSLRLLAESLRRLRTDHLDLWQLHDLRTQEDLSRIFGKDGAMKALLHARREGRHAFVSRRRDADGLTVPRRPATQERPATRRQLSWSPEPERSRSRHHARRRPRPRR